MTFFVDVTVLFLSGAVALSIRNSISTLPEIAPQSLYGLGMAFGAILLGYSLVLGLYRGSFRSNIRRQYTIAGKSYLFSIFTLLSFLYLLQIHDVPPRFSLLFLVLLPMGFVIGRTVVNRLNLVMQRSGYGRRSALILGYDRKGVETFERFKGFPELGYSVKAIALPHSQREIRSNGIMIVRYRQPGDLLPFIKKESIDSIFIPSVNFVINGESEVIDICRKNRIKLQLLSPESDSLLRNARIHDIAGISLVSPQRPNVEQLRGVMKRIFDFLAAVMLILLLSPVFMIAAVAIFLESGKPVIFRQVRSATKRGKRFYFLKFRSMVKGADEAKASLYRLNDSDGALFKLKKDPRLTRVGKILRRFSIDELPQLLNVLKGEMSLVGPRPLPIGDLDRLVQNTEFWDAIRDRGKVKPGITGLWQISGRSNVGFNEMVLLDLYYVENQSLLFDLEILFATIPAVIFGKGAY